MAWIPLDQARILDATGDAIAPDAVIVAYVPNDADGRGFRPTDTPFSPLLALGSHSYALYRLQCMTRPFCRRPPPVADDPMLHQHADDSPGWQLVLESLDDVAAWTEARSVPAYLVALPLFTDYGERYRPVLEQAVMAAAARGFRARSLIDDYRGRLPELGVSRYDGHPGKEAHAITAAVLQRFIGRPWVALGLRPTTSTDRLSRIQMHNHD